MGQNELVSKLHHEINRKQMHCIQGNGMKMDIGETEKGTWVALHTASALSQLQRKNNPTIDG